MIQLLLMTFFVTGQPQVAVEHPDSVEVGSGFTFSLSSNDPACTSLSAEPVFSEGLSFVASRSMRSSRYVDGVMEATCRLELLFEASYDGLQTIGPMHITAGGRIFTLPAETVFVAGRGGLSHSAREAGKPLLIEIEVPDGPVYPGAPFDVSYYLVSRIMVKNVQTGWGPPENGVARLVDSPETLVWQVLSGARRSRMITLEITAASDGAVRLPVMTANVWEAGEMFYGEGPLHTLQSDTLLLDVSPFPAEGMPRDFAGTVDSVSFSLRETTCGSRDHLLLLEATGPGVRSMRSLPDPSVAGPATLTPIGRETRVGEDTLRRSYLAVPGDTGLLCLGGDSLPWFDPEAARYRFSAIPACSISIEYLPAGCDSLVSASMGDPADERASLTVVLAILGTAAALTVLMLLRRRNGASKEIEDAGDMEELLSAFEWELAMLLTGGSRSCLGRDEAVEMMAEQGMPLLLQRRVQRLWKDLEQALAGGKPNASVLQKLGSECAETRDDVRRALRKGT